MTDAPGSDDERRARLLGAKLRGLVSEQLGEPVDATPHGFRSGAALVADGAAWVLVEERPVRALGAAIAWALRRDVERIHLVTETASGVLARRAAEFDLDVHVHAIEGRSLLDASPEPHEPPPPPSDAHLDQRERIAAGGATPLVERGVVTGDVRGLEVCRVVDDDVSGEVRLEVGVGAHDREAFGMLHGDLPTVDALATVVRVVRSHRRPDAPPHPLNRLASERYLRWRLLDDPSLVGASSLVPADPPVARDNLKDAVPCVAHGVDQEGRPLVVVCSVGVDLDLVPYAADARLAASGAAPAGVVGSAGRCVVVTPARDRLPLLDEMASLLRRPVELVSVDD